MNEKAEKMIIVLLSILWPLCCLFLSKVFSTADTERYRDICESKVDDGGRV